MFATSGTAHSTTPASLSIEQLRCVVDARVTHVGETCSLLLGGVLSESSKTVDGDLGGHGSGGGQLPGTTSDLSVRLLALPDSDSLSFHAFLHN